MTFSVATLSVTAAQAQDADHVTDVAKVQPPTADELGDFVGSFEGRDFTLEGSTLTYFRQGMQGAIELTPIGPDHFGIVIPPGGSGSGTSWSSDSNLQILAFRKWCHYELGHSEPRYVRDLPSYEATRSSKSVREWLMGMGSDPL